MFRRAGRVVLLGAGLVDSGCDGSADDVDEECDTVAAATEDADAGVEPDPPYFTAEVTPSGLATTTFSATDLRGEIEAEAWRMAADDNDHDASFAVSVTCHGTAPVPFVASAYADRATFSEEEQVFSRTSGTITISRWVKDSDFQDVWYASGSFDIAYTNESPDNSNPPITLQAVGAFANVVMETAPAR